MKHTLSRKNLVTIGILIILVGLLYTQYLRPNTLILDTVIPNTPQQGQTTIAFRLEGDTLLFPSQCLSAQWDMSNTRGVYINNNGVAAPESQTFCHLPAPNGIFAQLRVILPDDTAVNYDFKVRVLAYDPIFLALCLLIIGISISPFMGYFSSIHRLRWLIGTVSLLAILILIGMGIIITTRFLDDKPTVWDDALMFARYGHHLNETGVWSWNSGEPPVFGMTELVYGGFVASTISRTSDPIQAVQNTSTNYGMQWLLFGAIFMVSGLLISNKQEYISRLFLMIWFLLIGLSAHTNLLHHFTSGMGTTTVLVYVTLYIALSQWAKSASKSQVIIYGFVGVIGGFGFAVRPDVMLFTACVPLALFIFAKTKRDRYLALFMGIITIIVLVMQLFGAYLYFGSALPLPFFAKSGGIDDGYLANQYVAVSIDQLGAYLYSNRYLILLIMAGILANHKKFIKRIGVVEIGLIAGMVGYIGYYALFVTQIMPEHQRFYYPTLPIIIWLACIGVISLTERLYGLMAVMWRLFSHNLRLGMVMGVMVIATMSISNTLYEAYRFIYQHEITNYPPHDARWYKLAQFADVDNITVATTEVGAVAVANFSWRVIDLAGLNDTRFALGGFSADVLLDDYRPDLLYLPYPDYIEMIEAIVTHPHFSQNYTYFTAGQVRLPMGVAIRKDSPYYDQILAIATP
jgi:hypothetical protein